MAQCGALIARGSRCRNCSGARRLRDSYAWQRVRRAAIAAHPWCVDCGAPVDLTADHVVPLSEGGAPLDPANLEVRCRRCNSARRPR